LLDCLEHTPGDGAVRSVIWMHGLGASGADFVPLVPHLGLQETRFVFPQAPIRPVTINGGMQMPAWYDILTMERGPERESAADIRDAAEQVDELVQRELDRGVAHDHIVLAGFSQGAAMALHVGLRRPEPLAGIMVLSGYLLLEDTLADEVSDANASTPVFFGHGRDDEMVPLALGRHARDVVQGGRSVEWHDYAMGHELCHDELRDLAAWLHAALP